MSSRDGESGFNKLINNNMNRIKATKLHKFGNMISGLCGILDGLIIFFSFGNYNLNSELRFNIYRISNDFLYEKRD